MLSNENAVHTVRTQCKVLYANQYSNPSFGTFPQVFCSIPVFFRFPCGIFELSLIFYPFSTIFTHSPSPFSPHHGDPEKAGVM